MNKQEFSSDAAMKNIVKFEELETSDLIVDDIYNNLSKGNIKLIVVSLWKIPCLESAKIIHLQTL